MDSSVLEEKALPRFQIQLGRDNLLNEKAHQRAIAKSKLHDPFNWKMIFTMSENISVQQIRKEIKFRTRIARMQVEINKRTCPNIELVMH